MNIETIFGLVLQAALSCSSSLNRKGVQRSFAIRHSKVYKMFRDDDIVCGLSADEKIKNTISILKDEYSSISQ